MGIGSVEAETQPLDPWCRKQRTSRAWNLPNAVPRETAHHWFQNLGVCDRIASLSMRSPYMNYARAKLTAFSTWAFAASGWTHHTDRAKRCSSGNVSVTGRNTNVAKENLYHLRCNYEPSYLSLLPSTIRLRVEQTPCQIVAATQWLLSTSARIHVREMCARPITLHQHSFMRYLARPSTQAIVIAASRITQDCT